MIPRVMGSTRASRVFDCALAVESLARHRAWNREAGFQPAGPAASCRHSKRGKPARWPLPPKAAGKPFKKWDWDEFGRQFRASYEAQVAMFPQMSNLEVRKMIRANAKSALGWKLSVAGGGGYLVLVSQQPVTTAVQLKIRRFGELRKSLLCQTESGK